MRYELTDHEWTTIKPMLPNKPRGVPRVNDRRVLNGIFWVSRSKWKNDIALAQNPQAITLDDDAGYMRSELILDARRSQLLARCHEASSIR
jgi:transposase